MMVSVGRLNVRQCPFFQRSIVPVAGGFADSLPLYPPGPGRARSELIGPQKDKCSSRSGTSASMPAVPPWLGPLLNQKAAAETTGVVSQPHSSRVRRIFAIPIALVTGATPARASGDSRSPCSSGAHSRSACGRAFQLSRCSLSVPPPRPVLFPFTAVVL